MGEMTGKEVERTTSHWCETTWQVCRRFTEVSALSYRRFSSAEGPSKTSRLWAAGAASSASCSEVGRMLGLQQATLAHLNRNQSGILSTRRAHERQTSETRTRLRRELRGPAVRRA